MALVHSRFRTAFRHPKSPTSTTTRLNLSSYLTPRQRHIIYRKGLPQVSRFNMKATLMLLVSKYSKLQVAVSPCQARTYLRACIIPIRNTSSLSNSSYTIQENCSKMFRTRRTRANRGRKAATWRLSNSRCHTL